MKTQVSLYRGGIAASPYRGRFPVKDTGEDGHRVDELLAVPHLNPRAGHKMAAQEEHGQTQGSASRQHTAQSITAIRHELNGLLQGWFEYFKHSKSNMFATIDSYTRGRLRSILRKRRGGKGRGRGSDHQLWFNDFFLAHGLIS